MGRGRKSKHTNGDGPVGSRNGFQRKELRDGGRVSIFNACSNRCCPFEGPCCEDPGVSETTEMGKGILGSAAAAVAAARLGGSTG